MAELRSAKAKLRFALIIEDEPQEDTAIKKPNPQIPSLASDRMLRPEPEFVVVSTKTLCPFCEGDNVEGYSTKGKVRYYRCLRAECQAADHNGRFKKVKKTT